MKCNASSLLGRRAFLQLSGLAVAGSCLEPYANAAGTPPDLPTHVLYIRDGQVELAPGRYVSTTTYNGRLPGPVLRTAVGQRVVVDVYNQTGRNEHIHWQGQSLVDAPASLVPPRGVRRMEFVPQQAGVFLYHSGVVAAGDLGAGLYSGQAGALLVEPRRQAGHYDREWVVVLKGCEPYLRRGARGCEVGYSAITVNGRLPGHRDALCANTGERVLVHVLNADATQAYNLELPGHRFEVRALDGCPVPGAAVGTTTLRSSPGQRVSAYVVMNRPTGWRVREAAVPELRLGAGSVVESRADLVLERIEAARSGFNRWTVNGASFSAKDPRPVLYVHSGRRYQVKINNTSDETVSMHLQRHRLTLAGITRDVVDIGPREQVEVEFVADRHGPALFHSTRQLQQDFGLVASIQST